MPRNGTRRVSSPSPWLIAKVTRRFGEPGRIFVSFGPRDMYIAVDVNDFVSFPLNVLLVPDRSPCVVEPANAIIEGYKVTPLQVMTWMWRTSESNGTVPPFFEEAAHG